MRHVVAEVEKVAEHVMRSLKSVLQAEGRIEKSERCETSHSKGPNVTLSGQLLERTVLRCLGKELIRETQTRGSIRGLLP